MKPDIRLSPSLIQLESGRVFIVFDALGQGFQKVLEIDRSKQWFIHTVSAEKDIGKQRWIQKVSKWFNSTPQLYADVMDLARGVGKDVISGSSGVAVRKMSIFLCGFSCTFEFLPVVRHYMLSSIEV